jgi:Ca-activated chloride channel family protein
MDAADVEPTRLARAKLKLFDLLERRAAGQTALVVFSTAAFTVTPLTTDTRTIASLVAAVNTDIMPTQGSSLAAGLEKSAALLRQTGLTAGEILLMTDAEAEPADLKLAGDLRGEGLRVSVLAVGTEQGAPIGRPEGGFVTDANGQVVVPQLDARSLQRLAAAGGGRFAALASDDRDLDSLFPSRVALPVAAALDTDDGQSYEADIWRDRGSWLALALLPLLALAFRRGWVACVALFLVLPRAEAFEWADLWQRADQRGFEALQEQQPARAAELFKDPAWRGAAEYRAGDFGDSAATLDGLGSAENHYNRGNALAKNGELEGAIGAYDRVLEIEPEHADARYNRDLVQQYLNEQQQQQQQQQSQGEGEQQDQQGEQQGSSDQSGEQANSERSDTGEEAQDQQSSGSQDQSGDGDSEPEDTESEEQLAENGPENQPAGAEQTQGPQDVEKWASEQAAEQWLRRIPQDPGGLLRRKFLYQYQRLGVDQEGRSVRDDADKKPW